MKPAALNEGFLEFDIKAPHRPLLSLAEAALALGVVWKDVTGEDRRFGTPFVRELLENGELDGPRMDSAAGDVAYKKPDGSGTAFRKAKPRWEKVSRASLMLFAAKHWNLTEEEIGRRVLDASRKLSPSAQRLVAAEMVRNADAREQARKDRETTFGKR